ncbi:MAG TPA: VWA domain-containing protein [Aggregatilineales bacterium]|nr:VWA domain-containing protein [Aggregatilineales bacterium]
MQADYMLDYDVISMAEEHRLFLLARIQAHGVEEDDEKQRQPLNLSLVLDRSGSMQGQKLIYAREAAQFLVRNLTPHDRFSLVSYNNQVRVDVAPLHVSNKDKVNQAIQKIGASGGTNLSGGWLEGCSLVAKAIGKPQTVPEIQDGEATEPEPEKAIVPNWINRVLLVSDGLANHGITDSTQLASIARQKQSEGIRTTTMGVGMDFNEDLMRQMASEGGGRFYFIDDADKIPDIFKTELQSLLDVVCQNLVITVIPAAEIEQVRQLNDYASQESEDHIEFRLGDLSAYETKTLLLEINLAKMQNSGEIEIGKLRFDYDQIGKGDVQHRTLELPILVQVVEAEDFEVKTPNRDVVKSALMLKAAHARDEAVKNADRGQFENASQILTTAADDIENADIEDEELQSEHNKLREEAVDMEFGKERYDSHTRKVYSTMAYESTHSIIWNPGATGALRYSEHRASRHAQERQGHPPKFVKWNKESLELTQEMYRVGRGEDNDIILTEESVSKYHCRLIKSGDEWFLEDLDSTNGTFANRGVVYGRFKLSEGDVVSIGTVLFRFLGEPE